MSARPVKIADFMLFHESAIRRAVEEEKKSLSLLAASSIERTGSGKGAFSDRTAAAVVKMEEDLAAVVLDDGETVKRPEDWIRVFDAVKREAKSCERPQMIFDEWAAVFGGERIFASHSPRRGALIKQWIRERILLTARDKGLVSFTDEDIFSSVENADDVNMVCLSRPSGQQAKRKAG